MLSEKLDNSLCDFIEEARKQEKLLEDKEKDIQAIVGKCEEALMDPSSAKEILQEIIEEFKEAL